MSDVNKIICNYIAQEWIVKSKSNRAFATEHNIDEKTVRKILQPNGYNMPIKTLEKLCEARETKVSNFFELINL